MDKYELFACGHYLNWWPEHYNISDVLGELTGVEDYEIEICEFYGDYDNEIIAELIAIMVF